MSAFDDSKSAAQGHRIHSSLTRQMKRSISKMKESIQKITEYDIIEDEPLHAVPESLSVLARQTGFTKTEIRSLYRHFKQYCPTGAVTSKDFKPIYAKLFPLGDSRKYAQLVFNNFDEDGDGIVSFGDLLYAMACIVKGSVEERLSWIFRFYDLDGDGYISKPEMIIIMTAIYEMVQKHRISDCINHVERFFRKMDLNRDGLISKEEFVTTCKKDHRINGQLHLFDDVF